MRLAAAMLLAVTGCSFFQPWYAKPTPTHRIDCPDGDVLPTIDLFLAIGGILTGIGIAVGGGRGNSETAPIAWLAGFVVAGGVGTAFGLAAGRGFKHSSNCRAVNAPALIEARRVALKVAQLTNEATQAARAGDCQAVKKLGAQAQHIGPKLYDGVFRSEPRIAACFASPAPPRPSTPHCFDDTAESETMRMCLPSKADCEAATRMLPASTPPRACVLRSADPTQ